LGRQQIGMMISKITTADMNILKELIETGKLVPFVDKVYPLNAVVEAFSYLETHHARGKVVVTF
jgi:NADPH:quinone reductase-like Zn-dependent oxidoreductase